MILIKLKNFFCKFFIFHLICWWFHVQQLDLLQSYWKPDMKNWQGEQLVPLSLSHASVVASDLLEVKQQNQPANMHQQATAEHGQIGDAHFTVQCHMHSPTSPSHLEKIQRYHRCVGQEKRYLLMVENSCMQAAAVPNYLWSPTNMKKNKEEIQVWVEIWTWVLQCVSPVL